MKVKIYWLMLWFPLLVSCNTDTPCFEQNLSVASLEEQYQCADTRYLPVEVSENYLIIRSQEAFNHAVSGSCQPQIDFTKYDLLIGRKRLTSGNASIDYKLERDCSGKGLRLNVIFNQDETMVTPVITYHVLLPKLSSDEKVEVEFEVKR